MFYHTNPQKEQVANFQSAFAEAVAKSIENNSSEIVIVVHGKTNLDGVVSDAIGGIARKLQKPGGMTTLHDVKVFCETERSKSSFKSGVIVATHVSIKFLKKLIHDSRGTDLIYVPWSQEELDIHTSINKSIEI